MNYYAQVQIVVRVYLRLKKLLILVAILGLVVISVGAQAEAGMKVTPNVEVVFVLDTTGSMGGLIEGAKQKIGSIANQIAAGNPAPDIKMGLIAYRDKGDDYVTKVFPLDKAIILYQSKNKQNISL